MTRPCCFKLQENQVITCEQRYFTKLFHRIRVSSHTLQFGLCEEQINDTTVLFPLLAAWSYLLANSSYFDLFAPFKIYAMLV